MQIIEQIDRTSLLLEGEAVPQSNIYGDIERIVCVETGEMYILNDIIKPFNNEYMRVGYIKRVKPQNNNLWHIHHSKRTQSYYLLTHMLMDENFTRTSIGINEIVSTTFYKHIEYPDANCIYLLIRNRQEKKYYNMQELLKTHKDFIQYDNVDKYYDLYTFNVPDIFLDDYLKFCDGKYSEMSTNSKMRIYHFTSKNIDMQNLIQQRLSKSPKLKQQLEKMLKVKLEDSAELIPMPGVNDIFDPKRIAIKIFKENSDCEASF